MRVIKKSIEQAEANYNIQNIKYANQLTLLTDLLEADNLYQESRLNYIQANIAALSIYYRLLFITGKVLRRNSMETKQSKKTIFRKEDIKAIAVVVVVWGLSIL